MSKLIMKKNVKEQVSKIEKYCRLKSEEKRIKKEAEEIAKELKEELNVGKYETEGGYTLSVSERINYVYDPQRVYDMVKKKETFLKIVKVQATQAKKYLSPVQLQKAVIDQEQSIVLSVKDKGGE